MTVSNCPLQKRVVDRVLKWPSRLGQCVWVDNKFRRKCEDVKILRETSAIISAKMPKPVNCCVPGCLNNFRKGSGLQYYRIQKDMHLRKQYVLLIRNKTLKLESDNTRICSQHFEGGQKLHRQHLQSIFPWTKSKETRRELKRLEVPRAREYSKAKVPSV